MLKPRSYLTSAPKRLRLSCTATAIQHIRSLRPASTQAALPASASSTTDAAAASAPTPQRKTTNAIRTFQPRTPGMRHWRKPINEHLWKGGPLRQLTVVKKGQSKGGRNSTGRVVVRHRGGGHRRRIRMVDYVRMEGGLHRVERIEYDPNRSAHLALLVSEVTQNKSYIIAAEGMRAGDTVQSFRAGIPKSLKQDMGGEFDPGLFAARTSRRGNCLPVQMIPIGTQIYNVGSQALKGAVFCRSAGTFAMIMTKEEVGKKIKSVTVRLQSGEVRTVDPNACATIGVASNPFHQFAQLGKAGRSRYKNIRPTVRGLAMNASDHPHGGGRGKSKGNVHPRSIWGTPAKSGYKTRRKRNPNRFVVKERPRQHGRRKDKGK